MFGRGIVKLVLIAASVSLLTGGKAEAKGALAGKVFFLPKRPTDVAPKALTKLCAKLQPRATLKQNADKEWKAFAAAFFRRPAIPGPITIWLYLKGDKAAIKAKEPVQILTANEGAKTVLAYDMVLRANDGFNKGKSYHIWVGQIIGKREKVYARGLVTLE